MTADERKVATRFLDEYFRADPNACIYIRQALDDLAAKDREIERLRERFAIFAHAHNWLFWPTTPTNPQLDGRWLWSPIDGRLANPIAFAREILDGKETPA